MDPKRVATPADREAVAKKLGVGPSDAMVDDILRRGGYEVEDDEVPSIVETGPARPVPSEDGVMVDAQHHQLAIRFEIEPGLPDSIVEEVPRVVRHPMSLLFPDPTTEERTTLRESIVEQGRARGKAGHVNEPILVIRRGEVTQILDGWNRWTISRELGIECPMAEWDGRGTEWLAAKSRNLARRHMTAEQRYATFLLAAERLPEVGAQVERLRREGKWAEKEGGKKGGRGRRKTLASPDARVRGEKTAAKLAKIVAVSPSTAERVERAARAAPEKIADIAAGRITSQEVLRLSRRGQAVPKLAVLVLTDDSQAEQEGHIDGEVAIGRKTHWSSGKRGYVGSFCQALRHLARFTADPEDSRYILRGIHVVFGDGAIRMEATDGHRIMALRTQVDGELPAADIVIPPQLFRPIWDLFSSEPALTVSISDLEVGFTSPTARLFGRLLGGQYVAAQNHMTAILKYDRVAVVPVAPLIEAIKRTQIITQHLPAHPLMLRFGERPDVLLVTDAAGDTDTEIEGVAWAGDPFAVMLKSDYLLDFLTLLPNTANVELRMRTPQDPVGLVCGSATGAILPQRPIRLDLP